MPSSARRIAQLFVLAMAASVAATWVKAHLATTDRTTQTSQHSSISTCLPAMAVSERLRRPLG